MLRACIRNFKGGTREQAYKHGLFQPMKAFLVNNIYIIYAKVTAPFSQSKNGMTVEEGSL